MTLRFSIITLLVLHSGSGAISQPPPRNTGKVSYQFVDKKSLYVPGTANRIDTTTLYFNDSSSAYVQKVKRPSIGLLERKIQEDNLPTEGKAQVIEAVKAMMAKRDTLSSIYHKSGTNIVSTTYLDLNEDRRYCIMDSLVAFNWQLSPDTSSIMGFLCQGAVCESKVMGGGITRQFQAWYAPDIPVAFGPQKFSGLPGLILSIETKYYSFRAVEIELPISAKDVVKIECCKGYPSITMKQVVDKNKKLESDINNMKTLQENP